MAISSPGIGSGLDVNSIVSKLVALEKKPIALLQTKGTGLQAKLSAYGQIKSALATLDDAGTALINVDTWKGRTFASNSTAVTGSATSSALASSFAVEVIDLAQAQSVKSSQLASASPIGSAGSLAIQIGQWAGTGAGTTFTPGSGATVNVSVVATDTLSDIATKINSAGAGVSALVVTSAGQDQLLIRGTTTGDAAGFQILATDDLAAPITNGTGVGALAYAHNGTSYYGATQTQVAQNSSITIDGIAVSSATNSVSDAVPGVTLNLTAETTSAAQITVGVDKESVKTKVETFRTAYNAVRTLLTNFTKYDEATKTGGPLLGDGTAVGLDSMLRNLAGASGPTATAATAATMGRLSDIGLQMQRDGTLVTNTAKLATAVDSLDTLKTFLTNSASITSPGDGIARRIRDFARGANGVEGNVSGRNTALQNAITRNNKDIDSFNVRVARTETRLYAQFSRLDANIGTLNSLGNFVTQQIAQWNKTG